MTTDPISAVLERVLLRAKDLHGRHPWKASTDDIIEACARLVEDYGISLKGSAEVCCDGRFNLGGDDEFQYSKDEDEQGNPAVLIEVIHR